MLYQFDPLEEDSREEIAMRNAIELSAEDALLEGTQEEFERLMEKEQDGEDEKEKLEPVDLKKTMIFAIPLKTKQAAVVEVVIRELSVTCRKKA